MKNEIGSIPSNEYVQGKQNSFSPSVLFAIIEKIGEQKTGKRPTQNDLASITHCAQSIISKWKTGDKAMPIDAILAIANEYGCSVDTLLGRKGTVSIGFSNVLDVIDNMDSVLDNTSIQIGHTEPEYAEDADGRSYIIEPEKWVTQITISAEDTNSDEYIIWRYLNNKKAVLAVEDIDSATKQSLLDSLKSKALSTHSEIDLPFI